MKKPEPKQPVMDAGVYLLAKRSRLFRPGAALILAATLPPRKAKPAKGKGKRK